jgi:hypothetical protein
MEFWLKVRDRFDEMVNNILETPEFRRLFAVPVSPARLELARVQMRHRQGFVKGRRDGWAAVATKAPLDVKRAIWEHEKEELMFDERIGKAHLADEDLIDTETRLLPGVRAALLAWDYIFREYPWIQGLAAQHITERMNNSKVVRGGGFSERWGRKVLAELGEAHLDAGTRVHMVADVEHSEMFEAIFDRYILDDATAKAVISAAEDSLDLYRVFRGAIADAMLELN